MSELPENLVEKLYELFNDISPNENELLTSFLVFLASPQDRKKYVQILEMTLKSRPFIEFKKLVIEMAKDAKKSLDDASYKAVMHDVYNNYLVPCANKDNEI